MEKAAKDSIGNIEKTLEGLVNSLKISNNIVSKLIETDKTCVNDIHNHNGGELIQSFVENTASVLINLTFVSNEIFVLLKELKENNNKCKCTIDTIECPNEEPEKNKVKCQLTFDGYKGKEFEEKLCCLMNNYGVDTVNNTPDYILAKYLKKCLYSFNYIVGERDEWFNFKPFKNDGKSGGKEE